MDDMGNWDMLLERLGPVRHYSPISTVEIPQGQDRGPLVIGISCAEDLDEVTEVVRQRLAVLNIPASVVRVKVSGRVHPDILRHNKLEECGEPHPAGFGGFWYDVSDPTTFYVYLLHPSQAAAGEVMRFQLDDPGDYSRKRAVQPLQGDFTHIQLVDWYNHFSADWRKFYNSGEPSEYLDLVALPQFHYDESQRDGPPTLARAGVSPRLNRIRFQIQPDADVAAVRQALENRLAALGVPLEAVVIEVKPP